MANTPNIGLKKLSKGERNWDQGLNSNFDIIDTQIKTVKDAQVITQAKVDKSESTLQAQINAMNVGPGVQVDPRVSQALVDSELETHENLRGRNTKWENRVIDIENDVNKVSTSNPESSYESVISLPDTATNGQVSSSIFGNTITNKAGDGVTSPKIITLDTTKTYLLIKTDGGTVNIDGVDTAVPTKITGKTSTTLTFTTGKIGLYELLSTETGLATDLAKKYTYVTDTKSTVSNVKLKSVGKNLFNISRVNETCFVVCLKAVKNEIIDNRTLKITSSNPQTSGYGYIIGLKPFTTYRISATLESMVGRGVNINIGGDINWYENRLGIDSGYVGSRVARNFTTGYKPTGISFTTYDNNQIAILKDVMIEEGTVSTPYEPYKESNAYIVAKKDNEIVNLRSLPNGVKDEIRPDGKGGYELVKRTKEIILSSDDVIGIDKWTNVDIVRLRILNDANTTGWNNLTITKDVTLEGYEQTSFADNESKINKFITSDTKNVKVIVAKNTTLEQARQQLAGLKLIYQLAEPEIIPVQVSGSLESHPNGTIYVDKVHKDVYAYNVNIATHLPVDVNGVESIHLLSGNQKLPVDLSKVGRTTNDTNIRITGHGITNPATDKFIVNTTRGNALRAVTYKDNNNLTVTAIAGQTVGDNIVKLDKKTNIVAEAGANEIQTVKLGGANTGKFKLKLTVDNVEYTTADISAAVDLAVTAQNIKQALIGLPSIGSGSTFLSSVVGGNIDVEFKDGNVGNKDIPLMELLPGEAFNGVGFSVEEKVKGGGTSNTVVKKTGHTLAVGDYIRNTTRGNRVAKVKSIVDANHFSIEPGIDLQATGDTIEVYKSLGSISADIDNIITIDGAENGETYEVEYYYPAEDSTNAEFIYSYPQNTAGVIASHGHSIKNHAEKLSDHDSMILGLALKVVDLEIKTKGV